MGVPAAIRISCVVTLADSGGANRIRAPATIFRAALFVRAFSGELRPRADALPRASERRARRWGETAGRQHVFASPRARAARHFAIGHRQRLLSVSKHPRQGSARLTGEAAVREQGGFRAVPLPHAGTGPDAAGPRARFSATTVLPNLDRMAFAIAKRLRRVHADSLAGPSRRFLLREAARREEGECECSGGCAAKMQKVLHKRPPSAASRLCGRNSGRKFLLWSSQYPTGSFYQGR